MAAPLILAFDTSAAFCAAAVLLDDRVLAAAEEPMAMGQAERLMPLLAELLAMAGAGWRDLAAIGVGTGPGNFTGVRLSVSAARGLALSLGRPAIGVTRLEALAEGLPQPLAVIEDARRGALYLQRFGPTTAAELVEPDSLPDLGALPRTGGGAALIPGGVILPPAMPLAVAIARITARRLGTPQPRPAPLYLRAADAAVSSDPPPVILS
ncbi:MAG: tRNA (adenosine(37)-N6)-threonylcarbamoyltransferase complex dimerization subunit type 1 TsaB [Rhodobacteraceae bacterium]|nr:tRNA (adenosine(37)-N6)-threonylcarbamoyltransferase complex dimerization subunit type 1 TsaB [Paracoccaceae bacterium]